MEIDPLVLKNILMSKLNQAQDLGNYEIRSMCPNPEHSDSSHPNFFFNCLKQVGVCKTRCDGFSLNRLFQCLGIDLEGEIEDCETDCETNCGDVIDFNCYDDYEINGYNTQIEVIDYKKKMSKMSIDYKLNELQSKKVTTQNFHEYKQDDYQHCKQSLKYLKSRGFTDLDQLTKFNVGYELYKTKKGNKYPCVVFPCIIGGKCRFIQRRNISGKGPRFFNDVADKKSVVWGLDHLNKGSYVILCEGPFNALTWLSLGYNAVAILGTTVEKQQLYHFHHMLKIVNFDLDIVGELCYNKLKGLVRGKNIIDFRFSKDYDANDLLKLGKSQELIKRIEKVLGK